MTHIQLGELSSAFGSDTFGLSGLNSHAVGSNQQAVTLNTEEIASQRQELVDILASAGIEEDEVADFLAAYDYLNESEVRQQLSELDLEVWNEIEGSLMTATNDYISLLGTCIVASSEDQEAVIDCVAEALNQLGSDILTIFQGALTE